MLAEPVECCIEGWQAETVGIRMGAGGRIEDFQLERYQVPALLGDP